MPRVVLAVALTSALVLAARPLDPDRSIRAWSTGEPGLMPAALTRDAAVRDGRPREGTPGDTARRRHAAPSARMPALASAGHQTFMPLAGVRRTALRGMALAAWPCRGPIVRGPAITTPPVSCGTNALAVPASAVPSARLDVTQAP
jgi:hypothetical protein